MCVWRETSDGIVLSVRVKPGARHSGIDGFHDFADGTRALKLSVNAAPDKGKANAAAIAVLAKHFGFAKSTLGIVSGTASRTKQIMIHGDPGKISASLKPALQILQEKEDTT